MRKRQSPPSQSLTDDRLKREQVSISGARTAKAAALPSAALVEAQEKPSEWKVASAQQLPWRVELLAGRRRLLPRVDMAVSA
mmetsp:Transcript_54166/g.101757  ORF Transcript_54166/g.101757 Transcript_54166/m.101757 type:complete len:82 (-) Transcript_54166:67-312(-)